MLVYYATVVDTKDPKGLGRVQVKLRGFPADVVLTDGWLRMLQPAASASTGFVFLPEVNDEVAVLRGQDDSLESMLILGSVYNGKNKPVYSNKDGDNITKEIRTKAGNAITFTDKNGEEAVVITTAGAKITVSLSNKDKGAVLVEGADKVTIKATTDLAIEAQNVKITASKSLEMAGNADVKVKGGTMDVSGTQVNVKGSGPVAISGAMVDIG